MAGPRAAAGGPRACARAAAAGGGAGRARTRRAPPLCLPARPVRAWQRLKERLGRVGAGGEAAAPVPPPPEPQVGTDSRGQQIQEMHAPRFAEVAGAPGRQYQQHLSRARAALDGDGDGNPWAAPPIEIADAMFEPHQDQSLPEIGVSLYQQQLDRASELKAEAEVAARRAELAARRAAEAAEAAPRAPPPAPRPGPHRDFELTIKPRAFYANFDNLHAELRTVVEGMTPEEREYSLRMSGLPTMRYLREAGRPDLVAAITRHGGGLTVWGRMSGLHMPPSAAAPLSAALISAAAKDRLQHFREDSDDIRARLADERARPEFDAARFREAVAESPDPERRRQRAAAAAAAHDIHSRPFESVCLHVHPF